ncbi:MAG: AmmeMemoRadiSam system protein B [Planctomycetota bacterium]|jgi:AmmeMemoRadiSam system protein B
MGTESLPDHILRPHLRPIQPIPVQKDGRQLIALRDPTMLTQKTMLVAAPAFQALQRFNGSQTIEEIARHLGGQSKPILELARGLDQLGLLWGPTFEKIEADARAKLEEVGAFPTVATSGMGDDEKSCREQIDAYFEKTEDPEIDEPVSGIVAPHLDYERGWPNYAAAYHSVRHAEAPDRVVILGTNHFGLGDGVVLTEYGFESPLGRCPSDRAVTGKLIEKLGPALVVDQLDHLPEHSVELQLPWIQHCFGNVPIVAALMPDPLTPMIEDDSERVAAPAFIEALGETLEDVGGNTLYVSSSDLSHVGPQFGEPRPVDDQRRFDVERHDREMMAKFISSDADEFLAAFQWNKNPTRWCSIGSMWATLALAQPETVELIDYRQAYDEKGMVMVTSAAMALV